MDQDLLTKLLQDLDARQAGYAALDRAFAGQGPLTFLAPEVRTALDNRLDRVSVNINKLTVESLVERLRITGFNGVDVWGDWTRCDLDQLAPVAHTEAFVLGTAYVVVWGRHDLPTVSVESARQTCALVDPGTRQTVAAVKRWSTEKTTEAVLYEPDQITRLRANVTGATTAGFTTVEVLDNPLGVVPVVPLRNGGRILSTDRSEMADVLPLTDAITKMSTDMLTASEYGARPRRWASGVELVEDEDGNPASPFSEDDRMMISEASDARFGQLPGSDLAGYEAALGVLMRQVSAVTGLPEHMLGIGGDNPTSADSIRASEAALTAKAEARQAAFGRAWEQVAALMIAVRDGIDPASVHPQVRWADPSTRSQAQEADAIVKLHGEGILTTAEARERLGITTDRF